MEHGEERREVQGQPGAETETAGSHTQWQRDAHAQRGDGGGGQSAPGVPRLWCRGGGVAAGHVFTVYRGLGGCGALCEGGRVRGVGVEGLGVCVFYSNLYVYTPYMQCAATYTRS